MKIELENVKPRKSRHAALKLSQKNWAGRKLPEDQELIIKRCIHTSADFDYADNLCFSEDAVEKAMEAIKKGRMHRNRYSDGKSGINKKALARYGGEVFCFMSDEDVAEAAKKNGTTRATASMDRRRP
jgi:precorrin-8X/cobalt-precorrin-8 methylmutase